MPIPVLHIITRLIVGGAQENTMFTAVLLDKNLYRVEVISGPQTGSEGSLIEETRARGATLTIFPRLLRQISPINDVIVLWQLYRYIKKNQFTIVHTHSSKAGILGRIAAKLARTPIIFHTVHGWSFHDHMAGWLKSLYIFLEKFCASFTNRMIVVTKQDIKKGLDNRIGFSQQYLLIRSAIPLSDFTPENYDRDQIRSELGIPSDVPVLGNVGRFSAQKNPLDWVRIAGLVAKEIPDCYFLLVGDGPLRSDVEKAIHEEKITDRVILTGLRRDAGKMMAAMDVFLLTSLWEGLPRVIPQAMCMELPVVCYQIDGTQEIIEQGVNGFVYPSGDITSVANACKELLKDPDKRKLVGNNGKIFAVNEFDIKTMITNISSLYQEYLSK